MVSLKLLNIIRTHYTIKKKIMIANLNKKDIPFIKILISLNMIKFIKKLDNQKKYLIMINIESTFLKNLKTISRPSSIRYIDLKTINKITLKKNWILILSTNKGLTTNLSLRNRSKNGGILLFVIFN